ncbi:hypothetical protein SLNSH_24015 [Alsobacter soli]|uniref:Uncharacterized protein n=1 Tax=Alsobacter soli TaxID=2109933 RepID=A0A2T1HLE2_9HYPH|nr:hypothetical protein SLNSH_24015 [Alsobacter soli]
MRVSFPAPPSRVSAVEPPTSLSSPAPPWRRLAPSDQLPFTMAPAVPVWARAGLPPAESARPFGPSKV